MPRNLRRSRVLRTITNDSNVDKALREIYDRLDDLQPEKVEKASPLYNKKAPIGSTMIVKNTLGDESIAIKTDSGWKVDINSKYVSTNNNNFNPSKGTKSIKGEALLYDASSNLFASAELNINRIPQVTTDTNKFLVSDGGTIKYVTGENLLTYLGISSGEIIDWTVDQGGTDIHSGNYSDTNTTYTGGTNLTLAGTEFNVDDAFIKNNAADVMTVSDFGANAALKIDADQPDTAGAENSIGLQIDYDRAVATSGTANHNDKGIDLDVNTATLGIGAAWGIDIDVVGATSGTHTVKGVDIKVSGADKNHGLDITAPDGADDYHIKLIALDDTNDYATISLADTADLTIATVGTGTRDSDITLDADGKILLESAAGGVYVAEAGNASADSDAYGQLWVKSDTPNNLYFTDDTGQDIPLTNNGKARTWTNTSGGYKTNNNSSTVYYFQYYPNYHSWGNGDSSPTGLTYTDSYSYQWCATSPGVLTNISVTLRAFDTGLTDPVKFYVYKGVPANGATSTVLTLIGTTGTITPIASRQMALSTDISSSNDFAAGDKLWVMYKKDSTSGNQDLYFAVTISGEYT